MALYSKGNDSVGFKTVQLLKDQTLGIGSYGKVCKAKCDDLLCAAKLIHETLFDPTAHQLIAPQREHRLPIRRFEQECDFLSTIRHPNIIQYLGLYLDPDTGLSALLMELLDDSLTHFLESSTQPIPYHIQVNICHDITLALSFLHSNSIVHRDLSSNNVLLIGNAVRAKVTDFGMASLGDQNPRATHLTFTMCPGTDVYMPLEAVQDEPVYTEKIDCFSFGVITLQILTRQFPKPGNRRKAIEINQPGIPAGTMAEIRVPETERRQNHISIIDPNHTLLQVSLDCLKDRDVERPSAQQLCERVAALKESPEYSESVRVAEERNTAEQVRGNERDREMRSLRQQHTQQVQGLQQIIQSQMSRLEEKDQALREKDETIAAGQQRIGYLERCIEHKEIQERQQQNEVQRLEREKNEIIAGKDRLKEEKNQVIEEKERQLGRVNQQLKECEQVIAQFQRRNAELERTRPATRESVRIVQKTSTVKENRGDAPSTDMRIEDRNVPRASTANQVSGLYVEDKSPLANLRSKLKTIKEFETATQPNEELYKGTISEAIATALKDSLNTKVIEEQLSKMHQEGLFSSSVLKLALSEIEKQVKAISSHNDRAHPLRQCIPLKVNDVHLHDASLCSVAVNNYDTDGCIKLFQSLSKVSLRKVSISHFQERIAFPKCMIANVNDVFIIAFESHFDFKIWSKLHDEISNCTFGRGLERLIETFPTLYFETLIKENKTVIITGFSFGGVLAHMLAAQLQLHSDQLISNLLCITFGEPLIQSELLTNVAEVFPDFKSNVHAVFKDHDHIPFLMEKLDSFLCSHEGYFQAILNDLLCLQRCITSKENKPDLSTTGAHAESKTFGYLTPEHTTTLQAIDEQATRAENNLQVLLESFEKKSHNLVPEIDQPGVTTYRIVQSDTYPGDMKIFKYDQTEVRRKVTASDLTITKLQNHNAGVYNKCIKIYLLEQSSHDLSHSSPSLVTTSDFLSPIIEQIQVTQYGDEATVVVRGKQLWFSHSFKVDSVVKQPFQTQEGSVSFSVTVSEIRESIISGDGKEKEVCLYSYFTQPMTKKVPVEVNAKHLSPRGRQLARLEPAHLLELAFTMALLEKQQTRLDGSQMGEFSPLYHHIRSFLHEIAEVVPYESILCEIAYGRHKTTVDLCASLLEEHKICFPSSLLMYTCLLVTLSKSHGIVSDSQTPLEDTAYFSWMARKLFLKKYVMKMTEIAESEENSISSRDLPTVFKSLFVGIGSVASLTSVMEQKESSLVYISELFKRSELENNEDIPAVSRRSAVDLYQSLKSPVTVLNEGRKKLSQMNTTSENDPEENKKMISKLENARGEQFDCCIGVLCGFMYQHYRIPFTEENPVTVFKTVRLCAGPLWAALKSASRKSDDPFDSGKLFDSSTLISITKKCKKMVAKGTQIAECMYDGKLRFLVSNIDKAAVATIAPSSSDYIIYSLEQKLMELCSARGITTKTPIDTIVKSWVKYFNGSPLLDVAQSHRSLIVRWMKWSLMVTELRLTLEKYTTISVSGLVNSGKSQLMRNLFGLDVKTGTIESRRTTVPFIYTLDPDVKDVHVIDFPGVDDDDQDVIKPIEFLKFISQIVVFVIHYTKAHTAAAKEWLKRFEVTEGGSEDEMKLMRENPHSLMSGENFESKKKIRGENVPVLVCLTFADRLLVRDFMNDSEQYDRGEAKKGIAKHFEDISNKVYNQGVWNPQGRRTIGYYCFRLDKRTTLSEDDMKMVGIGTPMDVGNWICRQMREELHMPDSARKLQEYFEKSCRNLKC